MKHAFVLINCDLGNEASVISQLKSIEGVKAVQGTFGIYDILAEIESKNPEILKQTVTEKIRKLDHINSVHTLMATDDTESEKIMADLIPDIIPEEKKPLEPPTENVEFDEEEDEENELEDEDFKNNSRKK